MELIETFEYTFIQRAMLAGSIIAITCALLGVFLVLKKMSLIGDGLSHVSFGAIAFGLSLGLYPYYVAIPLVVISSLLILTLIDRAKVYADTAIGIVSAIGIASGVILASVSNGFNVDLFSYLFGSILAISSFEVYLSIALSALVIIILILFYRDLFAITYDEEYASTQGIKVQRVNKLLVILTAITVILSVKIVGVMLVSALLILPAVSALQITKRFHEVLLFSAFISFICVFFGIIFSFLIDIPTGATIVMLNAISLIIFLISKKLVN